MTASELKLAVAIARDLSIDLSQHDMDVLIGFGTPDFKPVHVALGCVARCLRWQCWRFNGTWDETQFNEDRPFYLRNVEITDLTVPELQAWLVNFVQQRLQLAA